MNHFDQDRTLPTSLEYQRAKRQGALTPLTDEPSRGLVAEHWHLKDNRFPYDARYMVSDMLVYDRPCAWQDIPPSHLAALMEALPDLLRIYDRVLINGSNMQSVKNIPHVHLLRERPWN